ncbi:glutathione S-transferase [Sphingomonas sp. CL5.1]|uniref:glutathione S-transferase family protein n=1 Tax=Sphingomonas sp. CL5.1 TaxID=2653203 RepID=UPI00158287F0|nr:glutathione S-transferase [Sphingomonas sp. CL5.1]QKS00986.1 glutathione S-transferase [Sphingomonas sp. CL5.1]
MLRIWGRLNSHNVKKVVWLAEELALPYERIDVGGAFGMDAAYLAKNPNRLIPTIEDGDFVLWESNAILRYLADSHPDAGLWPGSPRERALADRWMDWQFLYGEAQKDAFLNLVRKAPEERDTAAVERSKAACAKMLTVLEDALAREPWLSGTRFGIGDIPMGVYIHTWFTLPIERPDMPRLADWYRRLRERPGYAGRVAIPLS